MAAISRSPAFQPQPPENSPSVHQWNLANGRTIDLLRVGHELRLSVNDGRNTHQYLINPAAADESNIEETIQWLRTLQVGIREDGSPYIVYNGVEIQNFPAMNPPDRELGHPGMYMKGVAVTVLSCAAYTLPFFITFPLSGFIQIVALGVITAVSYGIINDLLATRQCLEYFTIGHTQIHKRLIESNNPTANAIVWGIHATWILGTLAGLVMATAARAFRFSAISAATLTPYAGALVLGTSLFAHLAAKAKEAELSKPQYREQLANHFDRTLFPAPGYHPVDLRRIPVEKRAAYVGVSQRNAIGYAFMPAGGLAITIGTIASRLFFTLL